ncbi:MAG: aminotransferase class I/II-fold pyridoxal phosphate-dependent enzyme [Enterocloster sp.]
MLINGFSKALCHDGLASGLCSSSRCHPGTDVQRSTQYAIMCAPTTSQYAAVAALRDGDPDVAMMRESYNQRRRYLLNAFREMGIDCFEPLGAFYTFPNISRFGMSSEEFATTLLKEEKVAVVPGTAFGDCWRGIREDILRLLLENLKEALGRMERFVKRLDGRE